MNVRFGVALPKELAEKVDEVAKKLGLPRSKVIEMAISVFLDYLNAMEDPEKSKLIVIIARREEFEKVVKVLKEKEIQGCVEAWKNFIIMVIRVEREAGELMEKLRGIKGTFHPIVLP